MIAKIKHLKNIGKFYQFDTRGSGLDWSNNTFVYAPNAYGKSTLVSVLKSLRDNNPSLLRARRTLVANPADQKAVITIDGVNYVFNGTRWEKPCDGIQIFDVPFIHENLLSHEIEHEHKKNIHGIIIGSQGRKFAEEFASLKTSEKSKRQEFDRLAKEFKQEGFICHTIDEFLSIPADEETAVLVRIPKLELDIKNKESETVVQQLDFPHEIITPSFNFGEIKELAARNLGSVHETAEKRVLKHIEHNIKDKEHAKAFLRQGLELMQADCPFCGQHIQNVRDLIQAYREFFDDTFRTYLEELNSKTDAFVGWNLENDLTKIVSLHNTNTSIAKGWEPFIGVQSLPDVAAFIEAARTKLNNIKLLIQNGLRKKQKDPNIAVDIASFDSMTIELDLLERFIATYNETLAIFTEKANAYLASLPKSDIEEIRKSLIMEQEIEKRFKPEWKEWVAKYLAAKKDVDDLRTKKDTKQKELEDYTKTIFDTYQTRINEILLTLGTDFQIANLTGKTDDRASESYSDFGFIILEQIVPLTARQNDLPCFKNTLSEGDKSTLAFAFFIAALEKLPDLDKQIVVLDDPLSSLDETRREATARILLGLSPMLNQLCVFTHKRDFLWMLCDKLPTHTVFQIRSDKKNGSSLEPFDVEEDRKGEHAKIIEEMERYINEDFGPTPDMMQGNIRKIVEIVLKTKYYRILATDIKAKNGLAKLLQVLFDAEVLPQSIKTQLYNLCNVANSVHHGEIVDAPSKTLTRDELIPLIRDALELLGKI